jgi:hypothetical protein
VIGRRFRNGHSQSTQKIVMSRPRAFVIPLLS